MSLEKKRVLVSNFPAKALKRLKILAMQHGTSGTNASAIRFGAMKYLELLDQQKSVTQGSG